MRGLALSPLCTPFRDRLRTVLFCSRKTPSNTCCDNSEGYREPSARQEESNLYECPSCCQDCAQLQCCKISNCLLTLHFSSVVNQNAQPFISFQRCATHLKIARWLAYVVEHLGTAPRCRTVHFGFKYGRNFSMPHACGESEPALSRLVQPPTL